MGYQPMNAMRERQRERERERERDPKNRCEWEGWGGGSAGVPQTPPPSPITAVKGWPLRGGCSGAVCGSEAVDMCLLW